MSHFSMVTWEIFGICLWEGKIGIYEIFSLLYVAAHGKSCGNCCSQALPRGYFRALFRGEGSCKAGILWEGADLWVCGLGQPC